MIELQLRTVFIQFLLFGLLSIRIISSIEFQKIVKTTFKAYLTDFSGERPFRRVHMSASEIKLAVCLGF